MKLLVEELYYYSATVFWYVLIFAIIGFVLNYQLLFTVAMIMVLTILTTYVIGLNKEVQNGNSKS